MTRIEAEFIIHGIEILVAVAHGTAKEKGWWDTERNDGECIALMHSELSEVLESMRGQGTFGQRKEAITHDLADCIIRICDYAGARGLDLGKSLVEAMEKNETRPHKHGKRF